MSPAGVVGLSRLVWLVLLAMVMFAAGAFVVVAARDDPTRVLGGIALLGAIAIVVANVVGNGKGDR